MPRVHLDPTGDERSADRILRRAGVGAGGDHVRAGLLQERRQVRGLGLEMHDDGNALPAERPVGEALAREPVQDGRVLRHPLDPLLAFRGERRIRDVGTGRGIHAANLSG